MMYSSDYEEDDGYNYEQTNPTPHYHDLPNGMHVTNEELRELNNKTSFSRKFDLTCTVCESCTYPLFRCQCDYIKSNMCSCEFLCNKCNLKRLDCECVKITIEQQYERDTDDESEYDSDGYKYYAPSYSVYEVTRYNDRYKKTKCVTCSTLTVCGRGYGYCMHKCECDTFCDSCEKPYHKCECENIIALPVSETLKKVTNIITQNPNNKLVHVFSNTNITTHEYLQLPFVKHYMITYANSSLCQTVIGKISRWKNRINMVLSNTNVCIPDEALNIIFTYLSDANGGGYDDMFFCFYSNGFIPFGKPVYSNYY